MQVEMAPHISERVYALVTRAAGLPDVQAAVEANHDDNRWWPRSVSDWRVRMTVAGWSTRVSYAMIDTYSKVVSQADALGWERLATLDDGDAMALVRPLGLAASRVRYLRSLAGFVAAADADGTDLAGMPPADLVRMLTAGISGAGYKVAQCAALYARGYHCGIIPADSGMVTKLAPFLGIPLSTSPAAHEELRHLLEANTTAMAGRYRDLATRLGYRITIPDEAAPTWLVHLVLIYFKRLYLNRPPAALCQARPACDEFLDCQCPAN